MSEASGVQVGGFKLKQQQYSGISVFQVVPLEAHYLHHRGKLNLRLLKCVLGGCKYCGHFGATLMLPPCGL